MDPDLAARIRAEYPHLAWALNDPSLAPIIAQMDTMTPQAFQAALYRSAFYLNHGEAIRQWEALKGADPSTANQRIWSQTSHVMDIAGPMGHDVFAGGGSWLWGVAEASLRFGWTDEQIRDHLVAQIGVDWSGQDRPGLIYGLKEQVQQTARQYGVAMSEQSAWDWGRRILAGDMSIEALVPQLQQDAKNLYAGNRTIVTAIESGRTLADLANPYFEIAARELGVNPATMDLLDPKWAKALHQLDPKSGEARPLTMEEWTRLLRTDSNYGWDFTMSARQQGAEFVTNTLNRFGLTA